MPGLNAPRLQELITYLVVHHGVPQPRVRIAFLKIGNMQPGEWRELSDSEVRALKKPLLSTSPHAPRQA